MQHIPVGLAQRYNDRGYLSRDPVFRRLQVDAQPFTWADSYANCPTRVDRELIAGEAADHGLKGGFVVPVITLDPEDAHRLAFAANYAIGRFVQLHAAADHCPVSLTPRKRECLLWSSDF